MKNLVALIIIVGALVAGGGFLISQKTAQVDEAVFKEKLHDIQMKSARQIPYTIQVSNDRLKFEEQQLVREHLKQVAELTKEHPEQNQEDQYILEREKAAKEGKKDKGKVAEYRERYDFLKERFEVLKAGYDTVLTGYQNGLRFDIVKIAPQLVEGKRTLRMDIFAWGPPPQQVNFGSITIQFVREIEEEVRGKKVVKQALAKIEGSGPPFIFHENAYEWIYEWPPSISVGYYLGLPLLAPDAKKMSLTMDFTVRTASGTTIPVEFKWENVDVDPSWRAPEGSPEWANVEVQEASAEELQAAGIKVDE